MSEKTVLCACSGMNPRGEVASGGNYQKFIDLARKNKVIAVNGCENKCPETILKTKDATVECNLNVSKLLKENNMKAECTVRINENNEKCVNVIKNEILSLKEII